MNLKARIKTYKFWVALSSAVVILTKSLGEAFGFDVSEKIIDNIIMGFCGVLVAIGIVDKPQESNKTGADTHTEQAKDEAQPK